MSALITGIEASGDVERLVAHLDGDLDALTATVLAALPEQDPHFGGRPSPQLAEHLDRVVRQSLRLHLRALRQGIVADAPPELDTAPLSALLGLGELELSLIVHRLSQRTLWEQWLLLSQDPEFVWQSSRQLISRGADFFFRSASLLSENAFEPHPPQPQPGNGGERRFLAVKGILEESSAAPPLDDFDLDRYHLALLAHGERAEQALRQLAALLERPLLLTGPRPDLRWAWISGARAFEPDEERSLAGFPAPAGITISLGLPAFGPDGFRATHRQALRTASFASGDRPALLRYEDIVVEALAGENEDDARAFVEHELQGIADDSETSRRLRETLRAYFAAEHNAACAAATLGVHEQTVANRLRSAEERLGRRSIGVRRVELELALRLRSFLVAEPAA
jgi:hypothetical protein